MISGHSDTEHLRYHVNGRLVFITDSSDCNTSIKMRAQRLLDIGQWDDKPLDLPFPSIFISKKDFKTP